MANLPSNTDRAWSTESTLVEVPRSLPASHGRGDLDIYVLIGKLRRTQQDDTVRDNAETKFDPLWANVRIDRSKLNCKAFERAVRASVIALVSQQQDKEALTLFHPIGKYILYDVSRYRGQVEPGQFNPPPTSIMSRLSPDSETRSPARPVTVHFCIHNNPAHVLTKPLHRLDKLLGGGPGGGNQLSLSEIHGTTPIAATSLRISRKDWAVAVELSLMALFLNGPSGLMQRVVTMRGRAVEYAIMRKNHRDLLLYLQWNLLFRWAGEGLPSLDRMVRTYGDSYKRYESGFLLIMIGLAEDIAVDHRLAEARARAHDRVLDEAMAYWQREAMIEELYG